MDVFLIVIALLWGCLWGAVTSIPLGPTGALIIGRALRRDRLGIYLVIAGFSGAHLVYQGLYHASASVPLAPQWAPGWGPRAMTAVGCALLVFLGIKYLMRAVGLSFRAHVQTQSDTTPPPSDRLASSNFEGILHDRSAPARSRLLSAPFFQSFGLAVLNPMLLFFLFTNATLFSSQFPGRVTEVHIVFLFAGTLVGTAAWYAGFGEILWRRAGTWNTRNRALAEGLSGVLLVAAAISLCMKTIF